MSKNKIKAYLCKECYTCCSIENSNYPYCSKCANAFKETKEARRNLIGNLLDLLIIILFFLVLGVILT